MDDSIPPTLEDNMNVVVTTTTASNPQQQQQVSTISSTFVLSSRRSSASATTDGGDNDLQGDDDDGEEVEGGGIVIRRKANSNDDENDQELIPSSRDEDYDDQEEEEENDDEKLRMQQHGPHHIINNKNVNDDGDDDEDDENNNDTTTANETEEERQHRLLKEEMEWEYVAPPNNKNKFDFFENGNPSKLFCSFNSELCSGNLCRVERTAPTKFDLYLANDGMGGPHPTGNKMWFFFSVTGVPHGTTLTFTLQQLPFVKTYIYGYTPVVAIDPSPNALITNSNKEKEKEKDSSSEFVLPKPVGGIMLGSKQYTRIPGPSVNVTPAPLPAHIQAARDEKERQLKAMREQKEKDQQLQTSSSTASPTTVKNNNKKDSKDESTTKKKKENPNPEYCHVSFDYTFDAVLKVRDPTTPINVTIPAEKQPQFTYYFAFCHPYPYEKLQRHLSIWGKNYGPCFQQEEKPAKVTSTDDEREQTSAVTPVSTPTTTTTSSSLEKPKVPLHKKHPIMYRELLTKTLDGHRIDMITITARPKDDEKYNPIETEDGENTNTSSASPTITEGFFGPNNCLPIMDPDAPIPTLQSINNNNNKENNNSTGKRKRIVPHIDSTFPKHRKYVLLSARVHPGEVPASHVMHGCIEFLLNSEDPRAIALRENFIFVIVPMINPDGVVRGHTRADSTGTNLNRMYKNPSPKKHPSVWALRHLMLHLANTSSNGRGLALYIDMHAHANKRGSFFYGNAMDAGRQIENLLYAKLVSLNSPFLMFNDCNFTTANMYSMGKTGVCRDGSSRVTAFLESNVVNSYTLECNSLMGPIGGGNGVAGLSGLSDAAGTSNTASGGLVGKVIAAELEDRMQGAPTAKYTPSGSFHDIGRAMMVSLLDFHSLNPLCRLPLLPEYKNITNLRNFLAAAIYNDAMDQSRKKKMNFNKNALLSLDSNNNGDSGSLKSTTTTKRSLLNEENEMMAAFFASPINSTIGPRALIPPTTVTSGVLSLQQAADRYQKFSSSIVGFSPVGTSVGGATSSSSSVLGSNNRKSALPPPHLRKAMANNKNSSSSFGVVTTSATTTTTAAAAKRKTSVPSSPTTTTGPTMRKQQQMVAQGASSGNSRKTSFSSTAGGGMHTLSRKRSISASNNNRKENNNK